MADPNTRSGKRTPVTLKIKFKSETLEQFIERYAVDVSQGGIFIRTKEPLAVGTQMKFEFQLRDASPLIAGEGTVVWTRENDPSRPAIAPGMGVRFDRLADGSQSVLERILAEKAKQQPQRPMHETTKPPLFADTPTKIAPIPVQDPGARPDRSERVTAPPASRSRHDSEQTPLPKPMPFHSDADEFDERAFEEATKVRSLEELAATTADSPENRAQTATTIIPPDELAMRRQQARMDSTLADPPLLDGPPDDEPAPHHPVIDRDSSPKLPSPPEAKHKSTPRALDTTPSPRTEQPTILDRPGAPPSESQRTKLGVEPAPMPRLSASNTKEPAFVKNLAGEGRSAAPRAVAAEPTRPVKKPSSAPIIVGILAVVALVCAGVWFFVLRDAVTDGTGDQMAVKKPMPGDNGGGSNGPAQPDKNNATNPNPPPPDKGSAVKPPDAPKVALVDTVIDTNEKTATIEVEGTDQKGAPPFKAQLEKGKPYKVHVHAPGFAVVDLDVKGGDAPVTAKLVAKPHVLTVTSDPPGAQISIDGQSTSKVTPADVDLKAFAGKTKVRVSLRKAGYRAFDTTVDVSGGAESTDKVVATMPGAQLALAPREVPRPPPPPPPHVGSGSDQGSASTTAGSNAGSAETPPPPPPDTGSAQAPTPPTPPPPPPPPRPAAVASRSRTSCTASSGQRDGSIHATR